MRHVKLMIPQDFDSEQSDAAADPSVPALSFSAAEYSGSQQLFNSTANAPLQDVTQASAGSETETVGSHKIVEPETSNSSLVPQSLPSDDTPTDASFLGIPILYWVIAFVAGVLLLGMLSTLMRVFGRKKKTRAAKIDPDKKVRGQFKRVRRETEKTEIENETETEKTEAQSPVPTTLEEDEFDFSADLEDAEFQQPEDVPEKSVLPAAAAIPVGAMAMGVAGLVQSKLDVSDSVLNNGEKEPFKEGDFTVEDDDEIYDDDDSELDMDLEFGGNMESDIELEREIEASESNKDFLNGVVEDEQATTTESDEEAVMNLKDDDSNAEMNFDLEGEVDFENSDSNFEFDLEDDGDQSNAAAAKSENPLALQSEAAESVDDSAEFEAFFEDSSPDLEQAIELQGPADVGENSTAGNGVAELAGDDLSDEFQDLLGGDAATDSVELVNDVVGEAAEAVELPAPVDAATSALGDVADVAGEGLNGASSAIGDIVGDATDGFADVTGGVADAAGDVIGTAGEAIEGFGGDALQGVTDAAGGVVDAVKQLAASVVMRFKA